MENEEKEKIEKIWKKNSRKKFAKKNQQKNLKKKNQEQKKPKNTIEIECKITINECSLKIVRKSFYLKAHRETDSERERETDRGKKEEGFPWVI